jgi:hypothetical protein
MCTSGHSRRRFLFSAGAAVSARIVGAQTDDAVILSRTDVESFLRDGRVINSRTLGVGITGSTKATLSLNGVTHDAHVQSVDESKAQFQTQMGTELNFRDCWMFNIAAYRLDCMLGLHMTPPSVARGWSGKSAAFTWWISNAMMEGERKKKKLEPPDPAVFNQQMYVVRVIDQLLFNTDRNLQNLLITPDWNLWMIDHTRCFRTRKDLAAPKNLVKCDRSLMARMRQLEHGELKQQIGEYIRPHELDAILARRDLIVKLFESKVAELGENRVLFDMPQRAATYRVAPPKLLAEKAG